MAHKDNLKLIDKYQFNDKKFFRKQGVDEFQAVHVDSRQSYTLKRVGISNGSEVELTQKLMQQLSILKKMSHPLIPKCHKLLRTFNNLYLIYDKISGNTLQHYLRDSLLEQNWKDKLKAFLRMAQQLCDVLAYLSDRRICHTHINMQNIIVQNDKVFKIINFSNAVELGNSDTSNYHFRNRKIDEYLAPQMKNENITQKTDVYGLGMVLQKIFVKFKKQVPRIVGRDESVIIQNILSFCKEQMLCEVLQRINAKQALKYFKERQFEVPKEIKSGKKQDKKETVESRGKTLSIDPSNIHKNTEEPRPIKQRSMSPFSFTIKLKTAQLSDVGPENKEYFYIARKVMHKRNLSALLLELSDFCTSLKHVSSKRSLPLSFLLIKKSALIMLHMGKFLNTGRGGGLKMDDRTRQKIRKNKLFALLQKAISTEMKKEQEALVNCAQAVKEALDTLDKNQPLAKQLQSEVVDNDYMLKCIADLQENVFFWGKTYDTKIDKQMKLSNLFDKKQLVLFYLLSLLNQYNTIEQIFEELFEQNGSLLWKQSFLVSMMALEETQIQALILNQGRINIPKNEQTLIRSRSIIGFRSNPR